MQADPASRFDLMWSDGNRFITQTGGGHNGGNIAFGPDGMLWIALGDGGGGGDGDLPNNAQNPATLLGKMIRIDVSVPDDDPAGYVVPGNNPYVGQKRRARGNLGFRLPQSVAVQLRRSRARRHRRADPRGRRREPVGGARLRSRPARMAA